MVQKASKAASSAVGLRRMFTPDSIAVVGASDSPGKAGYAMFRSLERFPGQLVPVNARGGTVLRRPACPSVLDLPEPVDLAVLVLPAPACPTVVEECAARGVGAAVICSGGFREAGPEGAEAEASVVAAAASAGVRLLGPNTSGFMNPGAGVAANFMPAAGALRPGGVGIVAQSGGFNLVLSFLHHGDGGGLSLAVGLGNAADVDFVDVLDHLREDEATRAIALHIEGVADGRELFDAVRRTVPVKPVVALKIGHADVSEFARSHTGALTGDWELTRAALAQAGAVVVDTPLELLDATKALACRRVAPKPRPGVGVVTGQAGPGLVIADELGSAGVAIPLLSDRTVAHLDGLIAPGTYRRNPVDTGRPDPLFTEVVSAVAAEPAIDCVVVNALQEEITPRIAADLAQRSAAGELPPTVFVSGGLTREIEPQRRDLLAAGIPLYVSPDRGATGAKALIADAVSVARLGRSTSLYVEGAVVPAGQEAFDEAEAKELLARTGLRFVDREVCEDREDARRAFGRLGPPVVVKLLRRGLMHKSDIGAVRTDIVTSDQLEAALDAIETAAGEGPVRYLVERQAPAGVELILGGLRDPSYGVTVVLGAGGIDVDSFGAPGMRLGPLTPDDALDLIEELPDGVRRGTRGRPAIPADELVPVLCAFAALLDANPHVTEVEVNPLRATPTGLYGLDAVIAVATHPPSTKET